MGGALDTRAARLAQAENGRAFAAVAADRALGAATVRRRTDRRTAIFCQEMVLVEILQVKSRVDSPQLVV